MARPSTPDEFYRIAIPPSTNPGVLLRKEPFTQGIPANARAWRIAYTTTGADGAPSVASAIVLVPPAPTSGPRPVIAWAHGTTGIAPGCAPSMMRRPLANVPAVDAILREGWAYVATDYAGLGASGRHGYLIGDDAARSVLDAIRAARQFQELALDDRIVIWGHSQGGHAALWAGMRAPAYSPELRVLGVAALAPASDLTALMASAPKSSFRKITTSYLLHAYSTFYPDVRLEDYVSPAMRVPVADLAQRCVGEWPTLISMLQATVLPERGIYLQQPTTGALGARLAENTPRQRIAEPVLIAQGQADDLVLPAVQDSYVAARCATGQTIEYRTYVGLDHLSLVAPDSAAGADLVAWSRDRFAGREAASTCSR